ncbi:B3 domain-containing protein At1g49475 [Linum perenne]
MSSSRNQARGTQPPSNTQAAQFPSHFFRIIVDEEEHSRMLPLPKKFARHSRETTTTLQTPPEEQWTVDIICDNDGTKQFAGQWNEFYSFNSIKLGHFLLFKHNGNNHFSVAIFDTSTCEIEYPIRNPEIFNNQSALESAPSFRILVFKKDTMDGSGSGVPAGRRFRLARERPLPHSDREGVCTEEIGDCGHHSTVVALLEAN